MNSTMARLAGAGILAYMALQAGGLAVPAVARPYAGTLPHVHTAAEVMAPADRAALAEALEAAGEMLAADKLGLVSTTEELQRFTKAALEFAYLGVAKPTDKYPAVAKTVQAALEIAIGTDVAPVTAEKRAAVAAALTEAGKAVR